MADVPALVEVDFLNGKKETILCEGKTAQQIMESIQFTSDQMEKSEMLKQSGLDQYVFSAKPGTSIVGFVPVEKQK